MKPASDSTTYSVMVGGIEMNDYLLNHHDAEAVANEWRSWGYDDVIVVRINETVFSEPVLPYNGTSGWSGSATSEARARKQDADGTTSARQKAVIELLKEAGTYGLTWKEAGVRLGLHHGAISGVLSVLHKRDIIVRLTEARQRCSVYVLKGYERDRQTAKYKPNASARLLIDVLNEIDGDLLAWDVPTARARIASVLEAFQSER